MPLRFIRGAAVAAGTLLAAFQAFGQTAPVELGPDDWQLTCEPNGCVVIKQVPVDAAGRRVLLTFAVPKNDPSVRMAILTPLGTALEPGLQLMVGADSAVYRFTTCMVDGCVVVVNLSPDDIANMAVQPQMTVMFHAVGREDPFDVAIPMADFDEAITRARAGEEQGD